LAIGERAALARLQRQPGEALGAELARGLGQLVELPAGVTSLAGQAQAAHHAAPGDRLREDAELALSHLRADVLDRQFEAQVGLVGAVAVEGLAEGQPPEGPGGQPLLRRDRLDQRGEERLGQGQHVLLADEGHLQVELGELRLAVGALVLVAEAARDLEIAVQPRDHQQLLELLGGLRQRVELAGVEPARHQIVARALGRARDHDRRLDLDEAAVREEVADVLDHPMAQDEVALHRRAAQVEIAVGQAQPLVGLDVVADREGGRVGGRQDRRRARLDLDRPGRQVRVDGALRARGDRPGHLQHVLAAHLRGDGVRRGGARRVEDDLGQPVAVAQVHEDQPAVVAPPADPALERDLAADVGGTQAATGGVGPVGVRPAGQVLGRRFRGRRLLGCRHSVHPVPSGRRARRHCPPTYGPPARRGTVSPEPNDSKGLTTVVY
jgi:hypothetical protein